MDWKCTHGVSYSAKCGLCSAEKKSGIHEQRRYEIARDVMAGLLSNGGTDYDDLTVAPRRAVQMADALLAALSARPEEER